MLGRRIRTRNTEEGSEMEFPDNVKYTKEHEWVRVEDDGSVTIGITDYAQQQLGDIVYVELPEVGEDPILKDAPFAVVESVKAVSDVYAPITGLITEVNDELPNSPEVINEDCYGDGWMVRMRPSDSNEIDDLLSAEEYEELINELS
jgi:glycine cleavage system H protein